MRLHSRSPIDSRDMFLPSVPFLMLTRDAWDSWGQSWGKARTQLAAAADDALPILRSLCPIPVPSETGRTYLSLAGAGKVSLQRVA